MTDTERSSPTIKHVASGLLMREMQETIDRLHKEVDQHIVTNITQPSTKRVFVQAPPANDRPTAPNEADD